MKDSHIKMLHCKPCNMVYFISTTKKCLTCKGKLKIKSFKAGQFDLFGIKAPKGY